MRHPLRNLTLALAALASLAVGLWLGGRYQASAPEAQDPYASIGGDFTLQSADGPVSLHDFRGKVVLIYFGYTSCPDVCPTSLAAMSAALSQLRPEELERVQGLFVTVDPERDDAARVKAYAAHFHPKILGLTGTSEEIAEVARRYLVIYEKVPMKESAMGYAVDHSSIVYLVGPDGRVRDLVRHSNSPAETVAALRKALAG